MFYLTPNWIEVESGRPNFQMYTFAVFYISSCNFMSTDFLLTLVVRQVSCWAFILFNILMWRRNHDFNIGANLLVNSVLILLLEGGNFCNMR